jgi:3-oxoacyl-[acyl-carrier-protein] synthase III
MSKKPQATITSLGAYLPERILSNADLEKIVETSNEWIVTRSGIEERRIAASDEFASTMGAKAAMDALKKANLEPDQVDAIIVATMTPDYITPSTACLIQHELKAEKACAFDVQAACSGFFFALSIAKTWVESGAFHNVLVIATEKNSAFIDYQDRTTCVLFGDGAGCALVQNGGKGYAIQNVCLGSDGEQSSLISVPAGGARQPANQHSIDGKQHYLKMVGKEVFKHAVRRMEASAKECLEKAGLKEEDLSWLIPHQANLRIMEAISKRFNIPWERVYRTIHKYGNTSSSTVPIALHELDSQNLIKEKENILLVAFGGGLTWGASLITKT